jgi:phosphoribosylaminoimidazole carboxylase PurE protein
MGSDSDWEIMQACHEQLQALRIAAEVRVCSAHRTPRELHELVQRAAQDGTAVFIAAAGMSAALAGTVAALTARPVIGVPVDSGSLQGLDALLSTAQMPPGVPVAAMAIGRAGARNAALFAARILALNDPDLAGRLEDFRRQQADDVRGKDAALARRIHLTDVSAGEKPAGS